MSSVPLLQSIEEVRLQLEEAEQILAKIEKSVTPRGPRLNQCVVEVDVTASPADGSAEDGDQSKPVSWATDCIKRNQSKSSSQPKAGREVSQSEPARGTSSKFMQKQTKTGYIAYLVAFISFLTFLGAVMAQSRAALFHMQAVGRWDNGKAYRFSYQWSVTVLAFWFQANIGFWRRVRHEGKKKKKQELGESPKGRPSPRSKSEGEPTDSRDWRRQPSNASFSSALMSETTATVSRALRFVRAPSFVVDFVEKDRSDRNWEIWRRKYALALFQVLLDMMSQWCSALALGAGVPATILVVFKSSGPIFIALFTIFGGHIGWWPQKRIGDAQWVAFAFLVSGLVLASYCEGGGGPRRRQQTGRGSNSSLEGIALLLLGEILRAISLKFQETCMASGLWKSSLHMQGVVGLMGFVVTLIIMVGLHHTYVRLPDGARHPVSDPVDVFTMCRNSHFLLLALVIHLSSHISSELAHLMILHHIDAVQRQLCDAFKVLAIWAFGKLWWYFDILPPLQEPWKPGLCGSVMMLPSMILIIYGMLLYKDNRLYIIPFVKRLMGYEDSEGSSGRTETEIDVHEPLDVGFDGNVYSRVYTKQFKTARLRFRCPDLNKDKIESILDKDSDSEIDEDLFHRMIGDDLRRTVSSLACPTKSLAPEILQDLKAEKALRATGKAKHQSY